MKKYQGIRYATKTNDFRICHVIMSHHGEVRIEGPDHRTRTALPPGLTEMRETE